MDKSEFTRRVIAMERTLYRISHTYLQNDADCADAVQDALLGAFSHIHQLREEKYFKTWLIRILIHSCYSIIKKSKRMTPIELPEGTWVDSAYPELDAAIMELPLTERMPVVMHYIEGVSIAEIARATDTPEGTIKWRMSKARQKLRYELSEEEALQV